MAKTKVFITPTTHWDREWVMTFGQYQVRLVNMIDHLIELIEKEPDYRFLLDGQVIALDDYLEIKPWQKDKIIALIEKGRLVTGPWYVLADQFLENGESAIRNLLFGIKKVKELGGKPMMVGYVPDSFGSIASLPMILKGFNINYANFGRGRPHWNERLPQYELWWESRDGSRILAANHGYANGTFLSYLDIWCDIFADSSYNPDHEAVMKVFMEEAGKQKEKAVTPNLYFSVGVDHMEPRFSLPAVIKYINEHQNIYELEYGMPEDYLTAVRNEAENLAAYTGEFRGSRVNPMELSGTLSSYMHLKQMNDDCEILLQRKIEPLWAMVTNLVGIEYPRGHLQKLWKLLLANHPHDSICGCSIDQVHKDMINRYEEIEGIGGYLVKDGLHYLISKINTAGNDGHAASLTVVNPSGLIHSGPVRELVRVPKRFKHHEYVIVDDNRRVIPSKIRHIKDKNKDLESVYMTNHQLASVLSKDAGDDRPDDQVFTVLYVDFIAEDVPGIGYRTYWIRPDTMGESVTPGVSLCGQGMENNYMKVSFNNNGTIDILDKGTGHVFYGLNYFIDREDTGNSYDHHSFTKPDDYDSRNCTINWHFYEKAAHFITFGAAMEWELPECITSEGIRSKCLKTMKINIFATLYANVNRLEMSVEMDNVCKDHSLRAVFDTGLYSGTVSAYDHFSVIDREAGELNSEWKDIPFQEFVNVSDGATGLCISTKGLPAYEAVETEKGIRLYLGLLRSVGRLGSAAGADYPTPGAQCQRCHKFEFAIIPHKGNWLEGDCLIESNNYRTPFLAEADVQHDGALPSSMSLLSLEYDGEKKPFVSCLKLAEDNTGMILRLWNPTGTTDTVFIKPAFPVKEAYLTSLDEAVIEKIDTGETVKFKLRPHGLTTVKIV